LRPYRHRVGGLGVALPIRLKPKSLNRDRCFHILREQNGQQIGSSDVVKERPQLAHRRW
jgi:hypothetical protein